MRIIIDILPSSTSDSSRDCESSPLAALLASPIVGSLAGSLLSSYFDRAAKRTPPESEPILFASQDVQPNEVRSISVIAPAAFAGERLFVPPSIAPYFTVEGMRVGDVEQMTDTGKGVPATVFASLEPAVRALLDVAPRGTSIVLRVRNSDSKAHDFAANLHGVRF